MSQQSSAELSPISTEFKTCLHVGCGLSGREETHHRFKGPEWVHTRLDIDPTVQPDIVDSIVTLEKVDPESCDGIFSSHNLEHLQYLDVNQALHSFHRVLRDRGLLAIVVPDFGLACKWVSQGHGLKTIYNSAAGPITPFDMIFGHVGMAAGNPFMQHKSGFTVDWLKNALIDVGFVGVEVAATDNFDIWAFARKMN